MKTPDREWPWYVKMFYGPNAEAPKRHGALAIETKHKTEASRDMDIEVGHAREDIGRVEWGRRFY